MKQSRNPNLAKEARVGVGCLVFACVSLVSHIARADDPPSTATPPSTSAGEPPVDQATIEARAHHRRGLELYDEGDYRLALVEFQRAYEVGKSYKTLFNIGQVYFQLQNYAKARLTLEQYLAQGGSAIPEARRAEVEKDLASLEKRTATLSVRANVAEAEVIVDDVVVGTTPLPAVVVNAGETRIRVEKRGFTARVQSVTLAGGDASTIVIELAPSKPDVVVTQTTNGLSGGVVASWIITGVLAAGTVGTGIAALAASSKYDTKRETPISGSVAEAKADLERQKNLVGGLAVATDILAVSTVVATGISLYLTFRPKPAPEAPQVRVQGLGATFSMGF